ncbi:SGNH/GDSL hydrolase family protein [Salinarimonas soli]|uniref:SGNH hydrolase-type esterase domain-containing protein n=1 Tax=Salinarimonas soli TaxID=1638099 RepID=A0A5B2VFC1_9HYPH|nr:SGNH/GDSL hydrolase family protein [Salinarimonas soli]KAA2237654.1 hypothetical protein F0L46_08210 [Salinarimonas soli]
MGGTIVPPYSRQLIAPSGSNTMRSPREWLTDIRAVNGPVLAVLGDSISARASTLSGTRKSYNSIGIPTWLNILSGQRFNFPLANNFGVSGDRIDQIAARVPNVIAARPDICLVLAGTNDITQNTPLATMQSGMTAILRDLLDAGILPIVIPILPRVTSGGASTTGAQKRRLASFNTWLAELCYGRADLVAAAGLTPRRLPIFVETRRALTDYTSATGEPLAGMLLDGLHPTAQGVYYVATAILAVLDRLFPPRPTTLADVLDIYDATDNLTGNRLISGSNNYGLMAGTGGTLVTATGLVPTGAVATFWRAARAIGAGNGSTLVLAKENPRTDGLGNGERQRMTVTLGGSGGLASEKYAFYVSGVTSGFAAGDVVFAEIAYELVGTPLNVQAILTEITETGPASPQTAQDGCYDTTVGGTHVFPNVPHKGVLRTPPITLQPGFTGLNIGAVVLMNAVSNIGSADIYWSDYSLRKIA